MVIIGLVYYGYEPHPDGYITTEYFVLFWIPLFPTKCLVVHEESGPKRLWFLPLSTRFRYTKLDKLYMPQVRRHLAKGYATLCLVILLGPLISDFIIDDTKMDYKEKRAVESHNRAYDAHLEGDHRWAVVQYSISLSDDSSDAITYNLRARCWSEINEPDSALRDYTKAIQLAPDSVDYRLSRADFFWDQSDHQSAMADYDSSILIDSMSFFAWYDKGLLHYDLNEYDRAIPLFVHSLELDSSFHVAYVDLGNCLLHTGDTVEAAINYRRYVSLVDSVTDSLSLDIIRLLESLEE